jgi:acyl-coenzyme A thioesterase PaaI-like protein
LRPDNLGCLVPEALPLGGTGKIDRRVDDLRPARRGDPLAPGRTARVGRTASVADVEGRDAGGAVVESQGR